MSKSSSTLTACPRCGRGLERRRRTALDRLRSLFTAKARYRCGARCGWEGLLPRIPREFGRSRYVLDSSQGAPQDLERRFSGN
jgi:hypothetical protein